jgi:GTP-binding protein HflX
MHVGGRDVVVTDPVGVIRDLPKDLFAAFRATFEEAAGADLLLQVIDVSDSACEEHLRTTDKLLEALELSDLPRLRVFNKVDQAVLEEAEHVAARHDGVLSCARDAGSVASLRLAIGARLTLGAEQADAEPVTVARDELPGDATWPPA